MLIILTTHPIQYQVPLWRALQKREDLEFEIWYITDHGVQPSLDREFGQVFAWDVDLVSGYPHRFLGGRQNTIRGFFGARLPSFDRELRHVGATALLINGWQTAAYWDAVRGAHTASVPVWLRAESNILHRTPRWKRPIKRLILGHLFRKVDWFLTIGSANRALYERYGIPRDRMRHAPYAVDNERFAMQSKALAPDRASIRQAWGIPADAYCVLFSGKLIPKKRPADLVEAVRQMGGRVPKTAGYRPLHLLFAGDGELSDTLKACCRVVVDETGPRAFGERASDLPVASFVGFLNQSQMPRAYAAADCLVLPSDSRETWGLVVNEALASGVPCIVSDACGCAQDIIAPMDPALVYPEGDVQSLVRALAHIASNRPTPAAMAERIAQFSVDVTADAIAALAGHRARREAAPLMSRT